MGKRVHRPGEVMRDFILRNVEKHPHDIVAKTAAKFECTPQAVHKHLRQLIEQGSIIKTGANKMPGYQLAQLAAIELDYPLNGKLVEDEIWERDVLPHLHSLPKNVIRIWGYAFTEMVNNAIDHSGGSKLRISLACTATTTQIEIIDNGVGIFRKIQAELDLIDERLAVFELSKGKFTTDPKNHTGQGIFFTSRMMDRFAIYSGNLIFDHEIGEKLDVLAERETPHRGTVVEMSLSNHTSRSTRKVFDEYSSKDGDYTFNKTIVPVKLGKLASELVSRSQAKRLLARVELFEVVMFDFTGIETIGQAFADEIFRVYARAHPSISMLPVNTTRQVSDMIARARAQLQ